MPTNKQPIKIELDGIFLVNKMHFVMHKYIDKILKSETGISLSKFFILVAIQTQKNISQSEIAEYVGITEAAVSKNIKILTKEGYINPKENNKGRITLSSQALALVKKSYAAIHLKMHTLFGKNFDVNRQLIEKSMKEMLPILEKELQK